MASTNDQLKAELQFSGEIHSWLTAALPVSEVGDLGTHLSDVRFSAAEVEKSIAALVGVSPQDRLAIRQCLLDVHTQLFRHLTLHLEQMREHLRDVIDSLDDE